MTAALDIKALLKVEAAPRIAPRVDLRTGRVAAGVLGAQPNLSAFVRAVTDARRIWRAAGFTAPLSVPLSPEVMTGLDLEWICDAAREAGCNPRGLTFELDERVLVRSGSFVADGLRARGWGVALLADPDCPLPLGARARSLYSEIILDAPDPVDPYLGVDPCERAPLGRRIFAAKEAGLVVTARTVRTQTHAAELALAGFDRAGGPVAADA